MIFKYSMMTKIWLLKLVLFSLFFPGFVFAQEAASLIKKVEGFSHPESVIFDEENDVFYISNIGENKVDDGFISKIGVDGENLDLKWIPNLRDPKGLLLHNGRLWVSDVTEVVIMDIELAEIIVRIPVEGAESLNDITVDDQGVIYISDMGKSSIFKRDERGEIMEWLDSDSLHNPNGLLAVENDLFVAAWGESKNGNVLRIDPNFKTIKEVTSTGLGNLDGIQQNDEEEFYVSAWDSGTIYKINKQGIPEELFTSEKSSGDILYYEKENQLVLPMNHQNAVWWYQIK